MVERSSGDLAADEHEQRLVARALANARLMEWVRRAEQAVLHGEKGTPGKQVQDEARAGRG